jgi:hypothetical protein
MPASSARLTGSLKACRSTSDTAMASAFAVIAAFSAFTISDAIDVCDPVHWYAQPSIAQASAMPYWVGTKNGFVVTWLTNTNLHSGCLGRPPDSPAARADSPRPTAASASRPAPELKPPRKKAAARQCCRTPIPLLDIAILGHLGCSVGVRRFLWANAPPREAGALGHRLERGRIPSGRRFCFGKELVDRGLGVFLARL